MEDPLLLLSDCIGREAALRKILRYSMYPLMFYRASVWSHSKRVSWLVRELSPCAQQVWGQDFDPIKAELMALIHDDAEIIIGDIQAGNKYRMTAEQLKEVEQLEEQAIQTISERFPLRIAGYNYKELLQSITQLNTREAVFVKFMDKLDGFGEALHEVYGGNASFEDAITNEYGIIPVPTAYYVDFYFKEFWKNFPVFEPLTPAAHSIFSQPRAQPFRTIALSRSSHTLQSISAASGYAHYDFWKDVVLRSGDEEEIANLYVQKEFA